jgi:transposase-like protein
LPAYKELLERESPGAHVDLLRDIHMRFKRIFVCPSVSRGTFTLCRRLVAVDGTFLKARFILTLLLAVGIDANGELVPLAWAVVESENGESWGWFLNHLRWALPELVIEESTLVSNRDKGLREAERALGGRVVVAHCCHHIKENFTEKFGRALQPLFWAAARAKTRAA